MKAIICTKPGPPDVLRLAEVERPAPRNDEVLVKIHAATVTVGDVMLRKARFPLTLVLRIFGIPGKQIPGHELAGQIEVVGADVKHFKAGDQVFGTTTGLGAGANAQYVCLPEEWAKGVLAVKPATMTYEQAAALPVGGMTALQLLQKADVQSGQKVLVYGASGSVGTYGVQLARHFGAKVTGVCSSRNVDLVKSLGADGVIDYTREEFSANGEAYDVIFDAVGKISPDYKRALKEKGAFVSVKSPTSEKIENLVFLRELAEAGAIEPVIDRRYPLQETAEAHRYVESGRKSGNVVITVDHD